VSDIATSALLSTEERTGSFTPQSAPATGTVLVMLCSLSRKTNKMQFCNRIYYSKV